MEQDLNLLLMRGQARAVAACCRLQFLARQQTGLSDPVADLLLVKFAFPHIQIAHLLMLGRSWRNRSQRRAAKKSDLDVFCKTMQAQEPSIVVGAIKG